MDKMTSTLRGLPTAAKIALIAIGGVAVAAGVVGMTKAKSTDNQ